MKKENQIPSKDCQIVILEISIWETHQMQHAVSDVVLQQEAHILLDVEILNEMNSTVCQ